MAKQLDHDRDLRRKERELSLRKEIYLAAAEAISAGIESIGRHGNLDLTQSEIGGEYSSRSAAIAKVYVIANPDTVEAVTRIVDELSSASLKLSSKRLPLMTLRTRVKSLESLVKSSQKEQETILELMKQYNLNGETDRRKWEILDQSYKFQAENVEKFQKEFEATQLAVITQNLSFLKECLSEMLAIRRLVTPVLVAARAELDIPLDANHYNRVIDASVALQAQRVDEFLAAIEAQVKKNEAQNTARA